MSVTQPPSCPFPLQTRSLAKTTPGPPLLIEGEAGLQQLMAWLQENRDWWRQQRVEHGALLFRGFQVGTAQAFEQIALTMEPELQNHYLGTSPREAITPYTFSASELPGFYPIPQHLEMSFLATPPRWLFFYCLHAPKRGGETPLTDFRRVMQDLDPEVLRRFQEGGLRIIRNYNGPEAKDGWDLWKMKAWHEVFATTDRNEVEKQCAEQGFHPEWLEQGRLRLTHEQNACRKHPETGEDVWSNHVQVFHLDAAPLEYQSILRHGKRFGVFPWYWLAKILVAIKRRRPSLAQALHCTYRDGSEIPKADLKHLQQVIWRHLTAIPWQKGDILAIDNASVAHGRLPYRGEREILVAWA
ncbi:MAG: taurine dioxygenase [Planctomycetota bacterium]|nr:MAG: taurine dioxygenase [Planctomycetota bacterium]